MDLREAFRQAAVADGLADRVIEAWVGAARPQLALVEGDGPVIGWFGGRPELPEGVDWPAGMAHIATVDLALVPAGSHDLDLPRDGRLVFFAETEGVPDAAYVVHVPDGAGVADAVPPGSPLVGRRQWSFPEGDHGLALSEAALGVLTELGNEDWRCPFSIGGYGYALTGNASEPLEDPATETVLATAYLYADDVSLAFTMTYADLAARRFDRVHLRYDWDG